jgi:hypothetical protein
VPDDRLPVVDGRLRPAPRPCGARGRLDAQRFLHGRGPLARSQVRPWPLGYADRAHGDRARCARRVRKARDEASTSAAEGRVPPQNLDQEIASKLGGLWAGPEAASRVAAPHWQTGTPRAVRDDRRNVPASPA